MLLQEIKHCFAKNVYSKYPFKICAIIIHSMQALIYEFYYHLKNKCIKILISTSYYVLIVSGMQIQIKILVSDRPHGQQNKEIYSAGFYQCFLLCLLNGNEHNPTQSRL